MPRSAAFCLLLPLMGSEAAGLVLARPVSDRGRIVLTAHDATPDGHGRERKVPDPNVGPGVREEYLQVVEREAAS